MKSPRQSISRSTLRSAVLQTPRPSSGLRPAISQYWPWRTPECTIHPPLPCARHPYLTIPICETTVPHRQKGLRTHSWQRSQTPPARISHHLVLSNLSKWDSLRGGIQMADMARRRSPGIPKHSQTNPNCAEEEATYCRSDALSSLCCAPRLYFDPIQDEQPTSSARRCAPAFPTLRMGILPTRLTATQHGPAAVPVTNAPSFPRTRTKQCATSRALRSSRGASRTQRSSSSTATRQASPPSSRSSQACACLRHHDLLYRSLSPYSVPTAPAHTQSSVGPVRRSVWHACNAACRARAATPTQGSTSGALTTFRNCTMSSSLSRYLQPSTLPAAAISLRPQEHYKRNG